MTYLQKLAAQYAEEMRLARARMAGLGIAPEEITEHAHSLLLVARGLEFQAVRAGSRVWVVAWLECRRCGLAVPSAPLHTPADLAEFLACGRVLHEVAECAGGW